MVEGFLPSRSVSSTELVGVAWPGEERLSTLRGRGEGGSTSAIVGKDRACRAAGCRVLGRTGVTKRAMAPE